VPEISTGAITGESGSRSPPVRFMWNHGEGMVSNYNGYYLKFSRLSYL